MKGSVTGKADGVAREIANRESSETKREAKKDCQRLALIVGVDTTKHTRAYVRTRVRQYEARER